MRLLVLLPLIGLAQPSEVFGFIAGAGAGGVSATRRGRSGPPSTTTAPASIDDSRRLATKMSSQEGVPAVFVSFGLTREERHAAEEAVFRRGPTFPAGVRFVDGSADVCATIREVGA